MGKWAARLADEFGETTIDGTDRTVKTGVLSVLSVTSKGGAEKSVSPTAVPLAVNSFTDANFAAVAWTDLDIARFLARRNRLVRWGWGERDAEEVAERLVKRDRESDDRVMCVDCQHWRPGRCGNSGRAGLSMPHLSRALAELLQRCNGFATAKEP